MANEAARPGSDEAGGSFLEWPAAMLAGFTVGLPQAFVSGLAGWAALQNELWSYGSAIQAEWAKRVAEQAAELPSWMPPWMVWHNGTEQLA